VLTEERDLGKGYKLYTADTEQEPLDDNSFRFLEITDTSLGRVIYEPRFSQGFMINAEVSYFQNPFHVSAFNRAHTADAAWFFEDTPHLVSSDYDWSLPQARLVTLGKHIPRHNILILNFSLELGDGEALLKAIIERGMPDLSGQTYEPEELTTNYLSEVANSRGNNLASLERLAQNQIVALQSKLSHYRELRRNFNVELNKLIEFQEKLNVVVRRVTPDKIFLTFPDVTIPENPDLHAEGKFGDIDAVIDYSPVFSEQLRPHIVLKDSDSPLLHGHCFHPHINSAGNMCFGNATSEIYNRATAGNLIGVVILLRECLSSYNPRDCMRSIDHFGVALYDNDEDEEDYDQCDDCASRGLAFCYWYCDSNEGRFSCEDCVDYSSPACIALCRGSELELNSTDCRMTCDSCTFNSVCPVRVVESISEGDDEEAAPSPDPADGAYVDRPEVFTYTVTTSDATDATCDGHTPDATDVTYNADLLEAGEDDDDDDEAVDATAEAMSDATDAVNEIASLREQLSDEEIHRCDSCFPETSQRCRLTTGRLWRRYRELLPAEQNDVR
jgi:hypothetical protein